VSRVSGGSSEKSWSQHDSHGYHLKKAESQDSDRTVNCFNIQAELFQVLDRTVSRFMENCFKIIYTLYVVVKN
jgi:hypothetical protein